MTNSRYHPQCERSLVSDQKCQKSLSQRARVELSHQGQFLFEACTMNRAQHTEASFLLREQQRSHDSGLGFLCAFTLKRWCCSI